VRQVRSDDADPGGQQTLGDLGDVELDALAFFEAAVARGVDLGVVDEDVRGVVVAGDEALANPPLNHFTIACAMF